MEQFDTRPVPVTEESRHLNASHYGSLSISILTLGSVWTLLQQVLLSVGLLERNRVIEGNYGIREVEFGNPVC